MAQESCLARDWKRDRNKV